jgi:hypothetical protein
MNIVKESNLGNIKSVFNDDASNSHYYKIIHKTIKGKVENLEFAKPIIQLNQGNISWLSKFDGPYINYTSLNIENKKHVDAVIKESLNSMASLLEGNNDPDFLDNIIEISNEEAIFYTKDASNRINVILTEWGYTTDEHKRKEGVLKKIFTSVMKSSLIIKFKTTKNELLEGVPTIITADDLNFKGVSDRDGAVKLNNLEKGNTIFVSSPDNIFDEVSLKVGSIEEYTIIVERKFTLTFKVTTSKNTPVANTDFFFKSQVFQNLNTQTDNIGNSFVKHRELDGNFELFSSLGDVLLHESLPSEDKTYTVVYDPPSKDDMVVPSEPSIIENIELEFLNWRKKPITQQQIEIYGQNGKTNYITDENGVVSVDKLRKEIEYGIFMNYKGTNWKTEFTHTDKVKYSFIVKRRQILWWWLPFLLFFFILLLIPTEITHQYNLLDKRTKEPISSAAISSSQTSLYQVQDYNDKTDSLGKLSIAYGKTPLYKQMFGRPYTDVFAKKTGYESLQAIVPLGYFKTRKSIIYLNKLQPPLNTEPIGDCDTGGDASKEGDDSVKEFDLKQSYGNFTFRYYTGDTHADEIMIFDCPKSEINYNDPIWVVDETTDDPKSVSLTFSNRIITVVVNGRGNLNSIWEYVVECPK